MAGGLARTGLLPVVNSFASFLASRANEQIYNNATERSKVIYVCHFGGLIPAGPGKSHQSMRDISLFGALPECTILQPCNAAETRLALEYLVERNGGVGVLRLAIGPSPRSIVLPARYAFVPGRGAVLTEGGDTVVLAYGPVLLHEALVAAETMAARGSGLTVVDHPWLNRVDADWLAALVRPYRRVCVVDDHAPVGGLGDRVARVMAEHGLMEGREFLALGVDRYPACGAPGEVLRHHGLEGTVLAERLLEGTGAAGRRRREPATRRPTPWRRRSEHLVQGAVVRELPRRATSCREGRRDPRGARGPRRALGKDHAPVPAARTGAPRSPTSAAATARSSGGCSEGYVNACGMDLSAELIEQGRRLGVANLTRATCSTSSRPAAARATCSSRAICSSTFPRASSSKCSRSAAPRSGPARHW